MSDSDNSSSSQATGDAEEATRTSYFWQSRVARLVIAPILAVTVGLLLGGWFAPTYVPRLAIFPKPPAQMIERLQVRDCSGRLYTDVELRRSAPKEFIQPDGSVAARITDWESNGVFWEDQGKKGARFFNIASSCM